MRSKWGQLKATRFALSAGTVVALAAVVGAGFKWG
jgi:ABC-type sugar transport system ATPase subunit